MRLVEVSLSAQIPFTISFLYSWLAIGLGIQFGLVFWPIGNYATLVYLLFYLPLVVLLIVDRLTVVSLYQHSDKTLLTLLVGVLAWVSISNLWADESSKVNLSEAIRINVLIFFYVLGVALLAQNHGTLLVFALILGLVLAAAVSVTSIHSQYYVHGMPLRWRLAIVGSAENTELKNSVVLGIYFGLGTAIGAVLLLCKRNGNKHQIFVQTILGTCVAALAVATYATGTRTALLSLSLTALLYCWLSGYRAVSASLAFVGVSVVVVSLLSEESPLHGLINRAGVFSMRPDAWNGMWKNISQFWFGAGFESDSSFPIQIGSGTSDLPHAHNFYLQTLFWCGIVGLAGYIVLYAKALTLSWRDWHQNTLIRTAICALSYFAVVQCFDVYSVFTKPSHYWTAIWLPMGIVLGANKADKLKKIKELETATSS